MGLILGLHVDPLPGGHGRAGQRRRGGTVGEQLGGKRGLAGGQYRRRDAGRQAEGQRHGYGQAPRQPRPAEAVPGR